tara:strand:+ start:854 stop:2665 length:1812 start_codon:yes stop_codon:yes gene_type:complete
MHLLTSTDIEPEDFDAAIEGYGLREFQLTIDEMLAIEDTSQPTRLLCALVAAGKLEIHVAKTPKGAGLYHDKLGFFEDEEGNTVAFQGSGNETFRGVSKFGNVERYSVCWDWEKKTWDSFGQYWKKDLQNAIDKHEYAGEVEVLKLTEIDPSIIKKHDISLDLENYSQSTDDDNGLFDYTKLHEAGPQKHQLDAIDMWVENGHRAAFEHATGTYKTATGLLAAEYSLQTGVKAVVISTPRKIISENWLKLITKCFHYNIKIVPCWSDYHGWQEKARAAINSGRNTILIFVNDSLWKPEGRSVCRALKNNWTIIADEAHNWEDDRANLFMDMFSPTHRLALSAQIADPNNPTSTDRLLDFFVRGDKGIKTDQLTLDEAIKRQFLRNYDYELKLIKISPKSTNSPPSRIANGIWRRFQKEKKTYAPLDSVNLLLEGKNRVLTYTGPNISDATSMLDSIQSTWAKKTPIPTSFRKVTSKENPSIRTKIIEEFNYGRTTGLVAIKVLDEGVDLPIADAAVMTTSSQDQRQWIQRRGRILRKREISDSTNAKIVDYILDISDFPDRVRDYLLQKGRQDLERISEFASSALPGSSEEVGRILIKGGWLL